MFDDRDSASDDFELTGSTLGIKSLTSTKSASEQQVLDIGEEIATIQAKIDATEIALQKIKQTHEQRKRTAEQELAELSSELQSAKETAEAALRQQDQRQEEDLQKLQKQFDDDLASLDAGIKRNLHDDEVWNERRKEARALGEQSKLYDLQSQLEQQRSQAEENQNMQALNQAQKRMQLEVDIETAKKNLQMLEDEISELTTVRREKLGEYKIKCSDMTNKMEARERDHNIMVARLQKELAQRDATFAHHIESAKAILDKEKDQSSSETAVFTTRYQSLQQLYHTTTKRGAQQMQNLNNDIEKLQKSVDEAQAGEQAIADKFKEDASKIQALQADIAKLKLDQQNIKSEIARVTQENNRAKRELTSLTKSTKLSATSLSRRSNYRSVYYP